MKNKVKELASLSAYLCDGLMKLDGTSLFHQSAGTRSLKYPTTNQREKIKKKKKKKHAVGLV